MSRRKTVLTFDRAVQRFLAFQQDQRGAAAGTITNYERVLGYVRDYLGADVDPLEIEEDDLLDVIAQWRKLSPGTRRLRTSIIRSFFSWLSKRYDVADPSVDLLLPRRRKKARRRLTTHDADKLLDAATTDHDRLIVGILAYTGIRNDELRHLRWRDLDLDERILRVVSGKGGKGREVPIPPGLCRDLRDVQARHAEHGHYKPSGYVVTGRDGGILGTSTAWGVLHRLADESGVDSEELGPHDLRRLYATRFLHANPGDLLRLQQILGHADISTTRVYVADADQASIRAAADRAFGEIVRPRIRLSRAEQETPAADAVTADDARIPGYPETPPSDGDRSIPDTDFVQPEEDS